MKAHWAKVALLLGIYVGAHFAAVAQDSQSADALVVKLSDVHRQDYRFEPRQSEGIKPFSLSFLFENKDESEVWALAKEAIATKRPVQVFDGTNIVTTCRVVGIATFHYGDTVTYHGLVLGFDSMVDAKHAALGMAEPLESIIRRKDNDRSGWIL